MAQAYLNQEDIKALEQTRQRLFQLTNNIQSLKQDVIRSNPLPQWSSLQTSASILAKNVESLTAYLSKHSDLFSRTVVYPSTNYPGRTQEGLMGMLLRKKLEPPIESWTDEGRSIGADAATGGSHDEELWAWAIEWMGTRVVTYAEKEEGKNYTADERKKGIENVNTGLRRKLEDDYSDEGDEEEDEDEDEEMEDVGVTVTSVRRMSSGQVDFGMGEVKHSEAGKGPNARSVEEILRFATSGAVVGGQR